MLKSHHLSTLLIHLLFIGIVVVLPEVILSQSFYRQGADGQWLPAVAYVKMGVVLLVFYLNYFLIFKCCLKDTSIRWHRYIGINIVLVAACVAFLTVWLPHIRPFYPHAPRKEMMQPPPKSPRFGPKKRAPLGRIASEDTILLLLAASLAGGMRMAQHNVKVQNRLSEIEDVGRKVELDNLKSQLNPHFLFNTLNSIYALIGINQSKAQQAVYELSGMLRYMLYTSASAATLGEECRLIRNYIELMKLRLNPSAQIICNLDTGGYDAVSIPPLLFLSLIENLFKHGDFTSGSAPAEVRLVVEEQRFTFETINPISSEEKNSNNKEGGIGLANLRRRLRLIYGPEAMLKTEITPENKFVVVLTIPLNKN